MLGKLLYTRGVPASGKSTWAKEAVVDWVLAGHFAARVNRDELRDMLHRRAYSGAVTEEAVTIAQHAMVSALLAQGYIVVVDDTNLQPDRLESLVGLALAAGVDHQLVDFTDVALETCIARDAARPGARELGRREGAQVGEEVIRGMHERYLSKTGAAPAL